MQDALMTMNGFVGLGLKALKICNAVPKPKGSTSATDILMNTPPPPTYSTPATYTAPTSATTDYSAYYDPSTYWQNYAWPAGYYDQAEAPAAVAVPQQEYYEACEIDTTNQTADSSEGRDLELVEHTVPLDVDKLNKELMEQDMNLWDALESSKWVSYDEFENP